MLIVQGPTNPRFQSLLLAGFAGKALAAFLYTAALCIYLRFFEPQRATGLIAQVASEIYHVPAERLAEYARLRVEAMVLRDQRGKRITEEDWGRITRLLEQSWSSLAIEVN